MAGRSGGESDVTYVGLLLGHGGDALQMLALASGVQDRGARVRIVLPEVPSSVKFKERCDELGIACERTPLISVSMQGSKQRLRSIVESARAGEPAPLRS